MSMRIGASPSRRIAGLALLAAGTLLAAFWLSGAAAGFGAWALDQQRALQGQLAQTIQEIRAGRGAALWALLALSAAYGFVHALGPGHGKVLVAGAAFGTAASARRMSLIALAGSVGQSLVAIVLVYGALGAFAATSRQAVGLEAALEPVAHLLVALIGAWLIARGLRAARRPTNACACGRHHAPDAAAASASPREALALIAAMAARPCAGALIVLVLAWRMDLAAVGAAAVVAMGLGTAAFTAAVAALAVTGREAALFSAGPSVGAARLGAAIQIGAGVVILLLSGALLHAGLS
jgi:nickel/cobalt transporter (NicO) family protein